MEPGVRVVPCVGGVVHDRAGRLLVVQRGREPDRGRWSVPGGRVEAGESIAEAVVREVAEETGLAVVAGAELGRVRVPGPGGVVYEVADLVCTLREPDAVPRAGDDAADVAFVDLAALRALPCTPGLLAALSGWGALPR
ncbi:NUDIX domain-containing protein [Modestobacter sp. I12A-02628]|uniref:NUDIX domain-containing protein n=1 Tax=Goekera deserti TaxID=2497753 RepID=A0A7K3W7T9_9ACTN|nr:NUDIX domain-containing protein [Goekera deserti]MPQ99825.1 NUDIX domain-containing protein [Goekera deserti]NDI49981.1 NUDIX domain-containing protein [Goekera deserti]NEL52542.1 NUDIX domain-containing protein [Goekera deserti]